MNYLPLANALAATNMPQLERERVNEENATKQTIFDMIQQRKQIEEQERLKKAIVQRQNPGLNAMGQPSFQPMAAPENFQEVQADEYNQQRQLALAQQVMPMFLNGFNQAQVSGADDIRSALVSKMEQIAEQTKNPFIAQQAEIYKNQKFYPDNKGASLFDLSKPEDRERYRREFPGEDVPESSTFNGWVNWSTKNGRKIPEKFNADKFGKGKESQKYWTSANAPGGKGKPVWEVENGVFKDAEGNILGNDDIEHKPQDLAGTRGRGMTGFIQVPRVPGVVMERASGHFYIDTPEGRKRLDGMTVQEQVKYWTPTIRKLMQAGGPQAAKAFVAYDTYKTEADKLVKMNEELSKSDKERLVKYKTSFRKLNQLDQWIGMNKGDNPQLAEYLKGTKLLADMLQTAVGGAQGGQWAFELATELLDPSLAPAAYEKVIRYHEETLKQKAENWEGLGTNPKSSSFREQPPLPHERNKKPQTPQTPPAQPAPKMKSKGKLTDLNEAKRYLKEAKGDKAKARELAKKDGWEL